ncbi:MAG TPA: hypothetical protein DCO77_02135 [Nitrospiraceae bacterium]|nr:hypothetical protein [Nitrospiraceae bacterium]
MKSTGLLPVAFFCFFAFMPLTAYAGVLDKEPLLWQVCVFGALASAALFFASRFKPWLSLIIAPVPLTFFIYLIQKINAPVVGRAIKQKFELSYIISSYASAGVLVVALLAGVYIGMERDSQ